jgi:hypothetical protein
MTKITAGTFIVEGLLKDYQFSENDAVFRFFINPKNPSACIEITMPKPSDTLIKVIERAGVKGLVNSEINFSTQRVKVNVGNSSLGDQYGNTVDRNAVGGAFFS